MTSRDDVAAAVADAHRREWGFVLAATARVAGSLDVAEECVQDAYGAALDTWLRDGVPVHIVAKRLGHKDPSVTLNVYADVIPDDDSSASTCSHGRCGVCQVPVPA